MVGHELILSTRCLGAEATSIDALTTAAAMVGVHSISLAPSLSPPPADELRGALKTRGLQVAAVQNIHAQARSTAELAAGGAEERARAFALGVASLANARRLGCALVILDLGTAEVEDGGQRRKQLERMVEREGLSASAIDLRDELIAARSRTELAALDRLTRALYRLLKIEPEMQLAVLTGEPVLGYPTRVMLELLFEDLRSPRLSYWHDTGRARVTELLSIEAEGAWLNNHASSLAGIYLSDVQGLTRGLPPGAGTVDFRALRGSLPSRSLKVVDIMPSAGLAALKLSFDHLRALSYEHGTS